MKNFETTSANAIITELKKISDQLKNCKPAENLEADFYRDSFDFMVDENTRMFESIKRMINEKGFNFKRVA